MPNWKPIDTLTNREAFTYYLVATQNGDVRLLLWQDKEQRWLGDREQDEPIPESDVCYWYDLPEPPSAFKNPVRV